MKIFYCDGSTRGKNQKGADNIGGWGAVCFSDENEMHIEAFEYDSETCTTNNRQELKGLLWCLRYADNFHHDEECIIYSDSAYVVNSLTNWAYTWEKNNWTRAKNASIQNLILIQEAFKILKNSPNIKLKKIDGHRGILGNELADSLATGNIKSFEMLIKNNNISFEESYNGNYLQNNK